MFKNFFDQFSTVTSGFIQFFSKKNRKKNREIYKRLLMMAEYDRYESSLKQLGVQVRIDYVKPFLDPTQVIALRKEYSMWQENIKQYDSLRNRLFTAS